MSFLEDLFGRGRFRSAPTPPFQASAPQGKTYTMAMLDGENAEITMYGEIVESRPIDWWTGEPEPGAFIIQGEFLQDLETVAGARNLTIRMSSIGGDAGVSILIHNRLRDMAAKGTHLKCVVDGVAMSGGSLIMCACDEVEVNPSSLIMIHNAACTIRGGHNANDLRQRAMALEDAEPLDIAASADKRSLFVRGQQFYLAPGVLAPDIIPTVKSEAPAPAKTHKTQPAITGDKGGKTMAKNLEELRAEAKAAVSASAGSGTPAPQAGADAVSAAVQAEQKRIQEIDAVASLYDAETVKAAKYGENACTAQEMTYRAAQAAAQKGKKFLSDLDDDTKASGAQGVPAAGDPGTPPPAEAQTPDQRMANARAEVKALFGKEEK